MAGKTQKSKVEAICQKLERRNYKCALSGWPISPDSFELDHIKSIQDGGSDEVDNLQCVHPLVNKAKGTMSNDQFIDMCRSVTDLHPPAGVKGTLGKMEK